MQRVCAGLRAADVIAVVVVGVLKSISSAHDPLTSQFEAVYATITRLAGQEKFSDDDIDAVIHMLLKDFARARPQINGGMTINARA